MITYPPKWKLSSISGVAGAGSGTYVLYVAQNLPDDSPYKLILFYFAPATAVTMNYVIFPFFRLILKWYLLRRLGKVNSRLVKKYDRKVSDTTLPDDERERYRKKRQRVEDLLIKMDEHQLEEIVDRIMTTNN